MAKYLTAIPDSKSGWILYSGNRIVSEGRDLLEAVGKRSKVLIGVPVNNAPSFSILVPTVDSALLEEMTYAQIEKRGLAAGSIKNTLFDYDIIEQSGNQTRLTVHLLDSPLPDGYIVKNASGYTPSPLVRPRTQNGAVLWKEHRQLILGLFRDGRLLHSHVLSGPADLSQDTANEINLLILSLQGDPALESELLEDLFIAIPENERSETSETIFTSSVNLETQFIDPKGVYRRAHPRSKLTPRSLTRYRSQIRFLIWSSIACVLLLFAYSTAGFFMWKASNDDNQKVAQLKKQISIIRPDVVAIQEMQEHWRIIEPAFEQRWFPMVQLLNVTNVLPSSGVVIREFETRNQSIYIKGDARDIQLAFQLESDLSSVPGLKHYKWSMPDPQIINNTASFRIEGIPKQEGDE